MNTKQKIQKLVNSKQNRAIRITSRTRSATGFNVIKPDGSIYHAGTKAEALAHLTVSVRAYSFPRWQVVVSK